MVLYVSIQGSMRNSAYHKKMTIITRKMERAFEGLISARKERGAYRISPSEKKNHVNNKIRTEAHSFLDVVVDQ